MKPKTLFFSGLLLVIFFSNQVRVSGHCEIPCGIYGDSLRIEQIEEHIRTVEKSMNKINELSRESDQNYNQLIRWITNKAEHAKKIQNIVSQYFLHQRIKPAESTNPERYESYITRLTLLHKLLIYAMNAKQTTDLEYIEKLRTTLHQFEAAYFHTH